MNRTPFDILPQLLVGLVAAAVVIFVFRFLKKKFANFDKTRRQCPNCGGWETYGSRSHEATTVYSYNCRLCNHTWTWDQTTPYPEVTVRPELIAAGEARLAQERRDQADRGSNVGPGSYG